MAETLTFNSLISDLQEYLERGTAVDPTVFSQLPRIINLAERDISRKLKIQGFLSVNNSILTQGQDQYDKPDDWKSTVSIMLYAPGETTKFPIFSRSHEFCKMYWPDNQVQGKPAFYADLDFDSRTLTPTPDKDYRIDEIYYRSLPLLDSTIQTNWLTDHAPDVLLHGCLLHCSRFLKNDERVPLWAESYKEGLSDINGEDLQRVIDRAARRDRA